MSTKYLVFSRHQSQLPGSNVQRPRHSQRHKGQANAQRPSPNARTQRWESPWKLGVVLEIGSWECLGLWKLVVGRCRRSDFIVSNNRRVVAGADVSLNHAALHRVENRLGGE